MLMTFELPAVQQFLKDLQAKRSGCFEGQFCSKLDHLIACQIEICRELNEAIAKWQSSVFRGLIDLNRDVESEFRVQVEQTYEIALPVVQLASDRQAECFEFARLAELSKQVQILERHLTKWVQPARAVRPAYRKVLTPNEIAILRTGMGVGKDRK